MKLKSLEDHCDMDGISSDEEDQSHKETPLGEHAGTEDGKLTISEISSALGMSKEEKTMSRVLNELKKCHPRINSSAVRNGRVFQYKYFLSGLGPKAKLVKQENVTRLRKRESKEEEKEVLPPVPQGFERQPSL